jgi:hypothetical protein
VQSRRKSYLKEPHEIRARIDEIEQIAPPLGQKYVGEDGKAKWIPRSDMSFFYWTFFETSNFTLLPYPGGLVDQPDWIMYDFSAYIEITEYNELLCEQQDLIERLDNV